MNFLALDTSGGYLSAVAMKIGEAFSCLIPDCATRHSVSLMGAVEEVLQKADLSLDECDFFAAVVGAGSFTGIRIGISAVKGFCLACKKPALPVTSFDVAAYNTIDNQKNLGKLLCLVDALHGYYYACGYENGEVCLPPAYLSEEEVLALAKEGYTLRATALLPLAEKAEVEVVCPVTGLKNAVSVLAEQGKFGDLAAVYVRKSSAEINLGK